MNTELHQTNLPSEGCGTWARSAYLRPALQGWNRRSFLGCLGTASFAAALAGIGSWQARGTPTGRIAAVPLPPGRPLRLKPLLVYYLDQRREKTSWRAYGGLRTAAEVDQEAARISAELAALRAKATFPLDILPLARVNSDTDARAQAEASADALLLFAASGPQHWLEKLAAAGKPAVLFVRHKSGPLYLYYEIAHWRLLRKSEDAPAEPNLDVDDVVVDEYDDVLWRLKALYAIQNTRGTKVLALGSLQAYSRPGQELGPKHVREVWGFDLVEFPHAELKARLEQVRANSDALREARQFSDTLLAQPNVALETDRRFVVNTFLALKVFRGLMQEKGAANLGVADCMGGLIPILDTPPCLALSVLNDEGLTAFCHVDMTHTVPGVLLRWISHQPSFVCNSHFPHHGVMTFAHCAAPRKMNGLEYEPTTIMTHYESDYGAATKVEYPKGQLVTCVIPNLHCTKWFGFGGRIEDSPNYPMCRSQMDVRIEGDWRKLTREMEGFHTIVCYGDHLREVGYALKRVGHIEWRDYSSAS